MCNNELKIMVPKGWVVNEEVMSDGSRVFTVKLDTATADDTACNQREGIFKLVPASKLRLDDSFMNHSPKTSREKIFKDMVEIAIKNGLKDFWRPIMDPSFDADGGICYQAGNKPAVGKSYNWWKKTAKNFCPERKSRLGTKAEYVAFLAVLIKELVASSGKSVEWAWNAVCNDSRELGHYWNSKDGKNVFETTGCREICGFFDLANICKMVAIDEVNFCRASGKYDDNGYYFPLSDLWIGGSRYDDCNISTGWIVLAEGSADH